MTTWQSAFSRLARFSIPSTQVRVHVLFHVQRSC
nr:MAG TPA: hypothetical protein [Caudoviricetes sp.]